MKWTPIERAYLHVCLKDRRYLEARDNLPVAFGKTLWKLMEAEMKKVGCERSSHSCRNYWLSQGKRKFDLDILKGHLPGQVNQVNVFHIEGSTIVVKVQSQAQIPPFNIMNTITWQELKKQDPLNKPSQKHLRVDHGLMKFPVVGGDVEKIAKQVVRYCKAWADMEDLIITGTGRQYLAIMETKRPEDDGEAAIQDMVKKINKTIAAVKDYGGSPMAHLLGLANPFGDQPAGLKIVFV